MTQSFPEYSHRLLTVASSLDMIARSDLRNLWQKFVVKILHKLSGYDPIYWVIDAVDESEPVQTFLGVLASLKTLRSQTTTKYFDRLRTSLPAQTISHTSMTNPEESLRL